MRHVAAPETGGTGSSSLMVAHPPSAPTQLNFLSSASLRYLPEPGVAAPRHTKNGLHLGLPWPESALLNFLI